MGFTEDDSWVQMTMAGAMTPAWGDEETEEKSDATAAAVMRTIFSRGCIRAGTYGGLGFDKRRSRLFYDIQSITLILPADKFPETGLQRQVATFKIQGFRRLFRSMPEEALWFNPQNSAEHKNLADAFLLRLFSARLIKVANPEDSFIADIYNTTPKEGLTCFTKDRAGALGIGTRALGILICSFNLYI